MEDVLFGVFVRGEARAAAKRMAEDESYEYDPEADADSEVVAVYVDAEDPGVKTREVALSGDDRLAALKACAFGEES